MRVSRIAVKAQAGCRLPSTSRICRSMRAASSTSWVTTTRLVRCLRLSVAHQVEHRVGGVAVEVAGGLVGEDARRLGDQRAGDGDALTLAAGKLTRTMRETMTEADLLEDRSGARQRLGAGHAANEERHGGVFLRGKLGQQMVELVDEAKRTIAQFAALGFAKSRRDRAPSG